eukprot:TRINITY_DN17725_c0_g1_i1.p1 TRINITY_DN17725_c0_g1~~TRINITY_DN17725_c0_g1_i1.p1  ORF type:complete len:711 (+),score=166.25 TRINITY_DN17725_c0_g1_i1:266-2134(+)
MQVMVVDQPRRRTTLSHEEALREFSTIHNLPKTRNLTAWLSSYADALKGKVIQLQVDEKQGRYSIGSLQDTMWRNLLLGAANAEMQLRYKIQQLAVEMSELRHRETDEIEENREISNILLYEATEYLLQSRLQYDIYELQTEEEHIRDLLEISQCQESKIISNQRMRNSQFLTYSVTESISQQVREPPKKPVEEVAPKEPEEVPKKDLLPVPDYELVSPYDEEVRPTSSSSQMSTTSLSQSSIDAQRSRITDDREPAGRNTIQLLEVKNWNGIEIQWTTDMMRIQRRYDTLLVLQERQERREIINQQSEIVDALQYKCLSHRKAILLYLRSAKQVMEHIIAPPESIARSLCIEEEHLRRLVLRDELDHAAIKIQQAVPSLTMENADMIMTDEQTNRMQLEREGYDAFEKNIISSRQIHLLSCQAHEELQRREINILRQQQLDILLKFVKDVVSGNRTDEIVEREGETRAKIKGAEHEIYQNLIECLNVRIKTIPSTQKATAMMAINRPTSTATVFAITSDERTERRDVCRQEERSRRSIQHIARHIIGVDLRRSSTATIPVSQNPIFDLVEQNLIERAVIIETESEVRQRIFLNRDNNCPKMTPHHPQPPPGGDTFLTNITW